jgi:hypothetical protein
MLHFAKYMVCHKHIACAFLTLGAQVINGKALKCSWGRHQARQSPMNMAVLSMAQPLANTMMLQQHQQRVFPIYPDCARDHLDSNRRLLELCVPRTHPGFKTSSLGSV